MRHVQLGGKKATVACLAQGGKSGSATLSLRYGAQDRDGGASCSRRTEMMKDGDKTALHGSGEEKERTKPPTEKEEEEEEEDNPKSSICCLQGCLAATAVGFSFFVALPTGILLVVYASNKDDVPLLSVGAVLISLPVVMLVVVVVLCFNQRRLARLGKNRVTSTSKRQKKHKLASSSSSSSSSSSVSSSVMTVSTTATATVTVTVARDSENESEVAGEKVAGIAGRENGYY